MITLESWSNFRKCLQIRRRDISESDLRVAFIMVGKQTLFESGVCMSDWTLVPAR